MVRTFIPLGKKSFIEWFEYLKWERIIYANKDIKCQAHEAFYTFNESKIDRIITFTCSDFVHVYYEGCGVAPMPPYMTHESIDAAKVRILLIKNIDYDKVEVKQYKK